MASHAVFVFASALGCDVKSAVLPASLRANASIKDRKTTGNSILPPFVRRADGDGLAVIQRSRALRREAYCACVRPIAMPVTSRWRES
jgi:hypothetical protein